jgi:hypothetical protein
MDADALGHGDSVIPPAVGLTAFGLPYRGCMRFYGLSVTFLE